MLTSWRYVPSYEVVWEALDTRCFVRWDHLAQPGVHGQGLVSRYEGMPAEPWISPRCDPRWLRTSVCALSHRWQALLSAVGELGEH